MRERPIAAQQLEERAAQAAGGADDHGETSGGKAVGVSAFVHRRIIGYFGTQPVAPSKMNPAATIWSRIEVLVV